MDKPPDYTGVLARDRMEWEILQLLLLSCDTKPRWPIEEVVRATHDPIIALDALAALHDVGLVRRRGRYVVITRAALRFFRLITWP
jgi:hypothetical protein